MTNPPLRGLEMRREFHNLTQADMAKVIEATQSQYQKFEKGTVRLDIHRAAKLAKRLSCTIDELL
jgi:DNA-binding XRE family transcriptional regulator